MNEHASYQTLHITRLSFEKDIKKFYYELCRDLTSSPNLSKAIRPKARTQPQSPTTMTFEP